MLPPSSARLTFRSWTDGDTGLAEALWWDPKVCLARMQSGDARDVYYVGNGDLANWLSLGVAGSGEGRRQ
jgi:hypothetical protein